MKIKKTVARLYRSHSISSTPNFQRCATQDSRDVSRGEKGRKKTSPWGSCCPEEAVHAGIVEARKEIGAAAAAQYWAVVQQAQRGRDGSICRPAIHARRSPEYSKLEEHLAEQRQLNPLTPPNRPPRHQKETGRRIRLEGAEGSDRWEQQSKEVTFRFPEYESH